MATNNELIAWLIDEYKMLMDLRKSAVKENAAETVGKIDREIHFIKLKLHPLELTDV